MNKSAILTVVARELVDEDLKYAIDAFEIQERSRIFIEGIKKRRILLGDSFRKQVEKFSNEEIIKVFKNYVDLSRFKDQPENYKELFRFDLVSAIADFLAGNENEDEVKDFIDNFEKRLQMERLLDLVTEDMMRFYGRQNIDQVLAKFPEVDKLKEFDMSNKSREFIMRTLAQNLIQQHKISTPDDYFHFLAPTIGETLEGVICNNMTTIQHRISRINPYYTLTDAAREIVEKYLPYLSSPLKKAAEVMIIERFRDKSRI